MQGVTAQETVLANFVNRNLILALTSAVAQAMLHVIAVLKTHVLIVKMVMNVVKRAA